MTKEETINSALQYFDQGYACSQSILLAFAPSYNLDEHTAKLISSTFGAGMGRLRQTCGAVTGGFMVLGLAYGNTDPKDMTTKLAAYKRVRDLNRLVEDIHGTSNCYELLKKHASEAEVAERKHHKIICRKVIADAAGIVFDMVEQKTV
ncbi:C-GCAxxG-C-C family protein [Williamwhitmania taraxaci]|uniref:C_GCAxxG_C_C family probable redox protein n=1 Tax=Williamwhitmania taraxaci TaxID=1640674 RepID=A0A1G6IIC2_9BACT|nr:C-GCAxxG-C-C family protein [Williamwhitmania taraxaci]SDC06153.1 C_GCAxxG_C_C family probable redox protein [Williamwhitmania taraxaci]